MDSTQVNAMSKKLNDLLAQSSDSLMCGPTCQEEKKKKSLEQNYFAAQGNVVTAPVMLQAAEKNYYEYTEGEAGYNAIREKELGDKAEIEIAKLKKAFASELGAVTALATSETAFLGAQANMIVLEDAAPPTSEQDLANNVALRKAYYEYKGGNSLSRVYTVLRWIYFVFAIVYVGMMFLYSSSSMAIKIITSLAVVTYPWYCNRITKGIMWLIAKLVSLLPRNIYTSL